MKTIHNNPYRIAGILSNATDRELLRQKGKISKYASIGKEIVSEFDFDFLTKIERTETELNRAFSGIEQNQDKVKHSLFWFVKANSFDEPALAYLIKGDKDKSLEIWEKVTNGKEVNSKNFSSFNNIGTLKLLSDDPNELKEGIEAKIKLLESVVFSEFVNVVADETYKPDTDKHIEIFIDELIPQFEGRFSSSETVQLFNNCNGKAQKYLSQKFTEDPIHNIERQIESAKSKRKSNSSDAYRTGISLVKKTKDDLSTLKSLLGPSDLKYKMLADNLAKEIMQCGIDFFQEWKESKDPSEEGLKLLKFAKSIAVGTQTIDRAKENIKGMKEWAETAPIKEDMVYVSRKLESFQNQSASIDNAKSLITSCKSRLQNIRQVLGSTDEYYLDISSAVVGNALGMVIEVVNSAQSGLEYNRAKLVLLPDIISNAVSALNAMGSLDMNSRTRLHFSENKRTIIGINSQMEGVRSQLRQSSTRQTSSSGNGCYIATMAYGDYEHPQVKELRLFRDNVLSRTRAGRTFIRNYYKYSPSLVEKLKDRKNINQLIRVTLDHFIKIIKK